MRSVFLVSGECLIGCCRCDVCNSMRTMWRYRSCGRFVKIIFVISTVAFVVARYHYSGSPSPSTVLGDPDSSDLPNDFALNQINKVRTNVRFLKLLHFGAVLRLLSMATKYLGSIAMNNQTHMMELARTLSLWRILFTNFDPFVWKTYGRRSTLLIRTRLCWMATSLPTIHLYPPS